MCIRDRYLLIPEFEQRGIEMDYTEELADLNASNLSNYDTLILYAEHPHISEQQELALLTFVESGKGLVAIHCASNSFRNSENFTHLIGGRYSSNGYGDFTTNISPEQANHPCLQTYETFETTGDTFTHKDLSEDITVLQTRKEGTRNEPWTWTRTQGQGRIFYTAYGNGRHTWENFEFHTLIANAVIWTSQKSNLQPVTEYPEFTYTYDKEGYLTNYEQRKKRLDQIQHPLPPEDSAKHNRLPEGFKATVFAAEPNIVNPIDITWDDRGRLYVAESLDYPHDLQEYGKGQDCITLCEDTDGDGKADKFTTFAEGLSIPTSILYHNGGIIVAHAPTFLFLKDTDGDDKADQIIELNRGWGTHDTHAGPSNLQYGLDNQIYGSVGYAGAPRNEAGERFHSGLFRFNIDGSNIEPLTNFTNNTWGIGITEDFEIFGSTANHDAALHIPIAYTDYEKSAVTKSGAAKIYDTARVFPLVPMRQVDAHGKYTAGSGFNICTARNYPKKYWNAAAFMGEPTGHLLGQCFLEPAGSSYRAINGENMLVSTDEYTSPVQARVGPDGNLWMVDWSNLIIQHNPIPNLKRGGFKSHNAGYGAHWNPLRDKKHGRIYRISYQGSETPELLNLEKASTEDLVLTLTNDNMLSVSYTHLTLPTKA